MWRRRRPQSGFAGRSTKAGQERREWERGHPGASSVVTRDREKRRLGDVGARERSKLRGLKRKDKTAPFDNRLTSKGCGVWEILQPFAFYGVPKGIRTPVTAVKGQCPRPLDDRDFN